MKDWIAAAGFAVFWRHNGAVTGTKASEEALKEFLTD